MKATLACLPLAILVACSTPVAPSTPASSGALPSPSPTSLHVLRLGEVSGTQTAAAPTPTSTIPPSPTWTPAPTLPPHVPQTIVLAPDVRVPEWSPDGRWISFWIPYQDVNDPNYFFINVKPVYYEDATGRTCSHDEFGGTMQMQFPTVFSYWQEDSRPVIVFDGGHIGTPCGDFTPISYTAIPGWDYALSPDGRYRAETVYDGEPAVATTFVSLVQSGDRVASFTWNPVGGQYGGVGARWITGRRLLLYGTDHGPLLVTVDGEVIHVLPDVFGVVPSTSLGVAGALDRVTGYYHLLLVSADQHSQLRLYHSETGQVENLPFTGVWSANWTSTGFSPDGRWLLLQQPLGGPEFDYDREWIRPVDGADADTKLYAQVANTMFWSGPDGPLAAQNHNNDGDSTLILTFPEGIVIQQWSLDNYRIFPLGWSPDGTKLLMQGYRKNSDPFYKDPQGVGLFLATIQP